MATREVHVLSLGAGVQSTALYLMFMRGEIAPQIDAAIFADTQEEPAKVYEHLKWLRGIGGPPILVRTVGKLGDDLRTGRNNTGGRFASIPSFVTADGSETVSIGRRQCSKEYKTEVIQRTIRREILGLHARARIPRSVTVHQYMGISLDEAGRAVRIRKTFAEKQKRFVPHFPLIERFWTRPDCLNYLADKVPHAVPRSACVFCPYHSDAEWWRLKNGDNPEDWARAVEIDHALRNKDSIMARGMNQTMYLHRSCKPLELVVLDTRPTMRDLQMDLSFAQVCEGVCGV